MTVADRIRQRREELNLTQEELAARMGLKGKSSVSKIESSGNAVTLKNISKCAQALSTTTNYLMGWYDNPDDRTITKEEILDLGKPWIELSKEVEKLYYSDRALKIAQAFDEADQETQRMVTHILEYAKLIGNNKPE